MALHGEEPLEELAIVHQCLAEVFGGRFLAASPLFFEAGARAGETSRELFDQVRDQEIGLVDAILRVIDEGGLHGAPPRTQFRELFIAE